MDELIYMDNAATTFPKPKEVYDFMHTFYQECGVNPGRSGFDKALETEEMVQSTRTMLMQMFNTFWCSNQTNEFDRLNPPLLQYIHRCSCRTSCCHLIHVRNCLVRRRLKRKYICSNIF